MFPKRLYLTAMAVKYIKAELKQHFRSQQAFADKVFPDVESRNLANYSTTINQRELQTLCNFFKITIEKLTGESFDGLYLSDKDGHRIKKMIKESGKNFAELAKNLAVDTATLKNWVYRYSSINYEHYTLLLKELNLETMVLDKPQQEIEEIDAVLEKQYQISQQMRAFLLGNNLLFSTASAIDPQTLDQSAVDAIVRQLKIPEKEVRIFRHNANEKKNFYAKIIVYGQTGRYILTFFSGWQPVDYGEITVTTRFVTAKHFFSGITFTTKKPKVASAKIATWFGEGSCLFAIRSAHPFEIEVQTENNLTEQGALEDDEMVIFLR